MAATPIATLNKTTHVSLLRILSLRFFRFHLVHLASPSGDARTRSGTLAGAVKGQGADSWPSLYLPLNAVICRGLDTVRGLQSELPGFATQRSKSGERDGRTRPRHTATYKTLRRPARFLEGNRGVPRPRRDNGAALGEAGGDARSQACARQDGLGLRFSRGVGCVGTRPEHSSRG